MATAKEKHLPFIRCLQVFGTMIRWTHHELGPVACESVLLTGLRVACEHYYGTLDSTTVPLCDLLRTAWEKLPTGVSFAELMAKLTLEEANGANVTIGELRQLFDLDAKVVPTTAASGTPYLRCFWDFIRGRTGWNFIKHGCQHPDFHETLSIIENVGIKRGGSAIEAEIPAKKPKLGTQPLLFNEQGLGIGANSPVPPVVHSVPAFAPVQNAESSTSNITNNTVPTQDFEKDPTVHLRDTKTEVGMEKTESRHGVEESHEKRPTDEKMMVFLSGSVTELSEKVASLMAEMAGMKEVVKDRDAKIANLKRALSAFTD